MDGVSMVANQLGREMTQRRLRGLLDPDSFERIFPRTPGQAGARGVRNRRILFSKTNADGSRSEFHATKGARHYAHG